MEFLEKRFSEGLDFFDGEGISSPEKIKYWLPHRYPFLMIDKVLELEKKHIIATKFVSFSEPFFQGHFPDNPIFPGVLQVEAMAQAIGIVVSSQLCSGDDNAMLLTKISEAKFKKQVVPGDRLIIASEVSALKLLPKDGGVFLQANARVYVGKQLISEAKISAVAPDLRKI